MKRRNFLFLAAASAVSARGRGERAWQGGRSPWPLCLDTATIRPQTLEDKVRLAARHGFDAIEPWEGELNQYEQGGGSLPDLGRRIADAGLFVPSVIGLWKALPATEEAFRNNLEACRTRMRQARDIGARHVQVIPQFDWPKVQPAGSLDRGFMARCYRELLVMGMEEYGLEPAVVFLEFVHDLRTVDHALELIALADHAKARMIPDTFHMHVGGSDPASLARVPGDRIAIFQVADAPAGVAREQLKDKDRVLPGDGILPLADTFRVLRNIGYRGCLSLELYNPDYHRRDPDAFLAEAHEKLLGVIAQV